MLPAWLAILLLLKLLVKLGVIVKPLTGHLPTAFNHPMTVALAVFLIFCLFVGLLFHAGIGRATGKLIEGSVFRRIPGYATLRSIAAKAGGFNADQDFQPALIEVEDGCLAPAFLIEEHGNDTSTVFVPSVPTPMAGAVFIMPSARIHPVDVPVTTMMKCISKWGSGSSEILAKIDLARLTGPGR